MPSPLAKALVACREAHDLSAVQLASLLGVSYSAVWNWEHRCAQPRPSHVRELAAIGCDVTPYITPTVTGKTIREWRTENDISQSKLAELLHVSPSTVSAWETKRKRPLPPTRRDLFALGCPPDNGRDPTTGYWGSCEQCPKQEACQRSVAQGLWCLCEVEPPLATDLLRAHQINPNKHPLDDHTFAEALDRIPNPPERVAPTPMPEVRVWL